MPFLGFDLLWLPRELQGPIADGTFFRAVVFRATWCKIS